MWNNFEFLAQKRKGKQTHKKIMKNHLNDLDFFLVKIEKYIPSMWEENPVEYMNWMILVFPKIVFFWFSYIK